MDALEYYVVELERVVNRNDFWSGSERADALEEAARNLITAWDAENSPDPGPTDGTAYVATNPQEGRIVRVVASPHARMIGTYRVLNPEWGVALHLATQKTVQINWDAVEWEYES